MQEYTTTVRSVGVDTLTCTAGPDGRLDDLRKTGVALLMDHAAKGNRVFPFKRGPYVGGQTKKIGYGEWRGRGLVELRGDAAYDLWPQVLPLADKISRLDVQVSVHQEPYDKDLAFRAWLGSTEAAAIEGRPSQYDLYARRGKGTTLYVGDGASRFLARLYERFEAHHDDAEKDVWRYEVQCRRERAQQMADQLVRMGDLQPYLQGYVHSHFDRRGVHPIFHPQADVTVAPLPTPPSDDERTLRWLSRAVRGPLSRLAAGGKENAALRALGLERLAREDGEP